MVQLSEDLSCEKGLLKLPLFNYLTQEELVYLVKNKYEVQFNQGETIFKQGGPITHFACLTSGMIKIYLEDGKKKNLMLKILKPTQLVGGPGFMIDSRHHFSVAALEKTTVSLFDMNIFREILIKNSKIALQFIGHLNKIHIYLQEKLLSLTQKNMYSRVADTLLYLSNDIYESLSFKTTLTRQDMADHAAIAKESFIRKLTQLKEEGIIQFEESSFHIKDMQKLQKVSETQ